MKILSSLWQRGNSAQAALVALACAPLLYFSAATRGALILCPDDCLTLTMPLRATAAQLLREGHLPLWNPYYYGGMPLFAAAQGGLLFPLNWFFLFLPAQAAANISTLGAYALAGVGAFLYARRNGASVLGAFVSGLVWQWGGFLVAHLGHTNVVHAAALLPFMLWAIDNYAGTRRRTHAALVALLVALQIFAGHQQTPVYSLMLAAAYAIFHGLRAREQSERRPYFVALSMLMFGVILAAVQILPTFELMRNSLRAEATYEFFSSYSLPPSFLLTYFAPYLFGGGDGDFFGATYIAPPSYAEYVGYVGISALTLALLAPLLRRDALTRFWTVVALVALALALGRFWPFDLYRVVYYVPVLNLFRAPARHVMEVDFALAVLAGRAVTTLEASSRRAHTTALTMLVAVVVFIFVCLSVTALRPAGFGLNHPVLRVSLLRAPELFFPVFFAALSAWALWRFARGRRASSYLLLLVLAADVCLWGHFSGWRHSPGREHPVWRTPEAVEFLRSREEDGNVRSRILTIDGRFYPGAVQVIPPPPLVEFTLEVQPNIYMLHGIQNAAGSDGFGLSRYSRLTGDMRLSGELAMPEQALGPSRAFDLLHTRYLIARPPVTMPAPGQAEQGEETPPAVSLVQIGGLPFAASEMKIPHLAGQDYRFAFPRLTATRVALLTTLEQSSNARQGDTVATLHLQTDDGREFRFDLRAGVDTSEWSHEREAARRRIEHERANVGTSYPVADPEGNFEGHTYVTSFALPERANITGGFIEIVRTPQTPQLNLVLSRASLIDDQTGRVMPWRSGWVAAERALAFSTTDERWRRVGELRDVWIYENQRALPRAWLASEALSLPDKTVLRVIQGGRLDDGSVWKPRRTALLNEEDTPFTLSGEGEPGEAVVGRYEPNLIEVRTSSDAPAILVLGENHYPGWNAFVDGRAVETLRVNYNLRGVVLPAGAHLVEFVYRPKSLLLGAALSLLAAMSLSLWCFRRRPLLNVWILRLLRKTAGKSH